jgi:hypothetical protein
MSLFLFRKSTVTGWTSWQRFLVFRTNFRDLHEVSCAHLKSCVVLRFVLDSVPLGTPTQSEFPDLGSHGRFLTFRRPKKDLTSTEVFFFTVRIALGRLLFPALLFLALSNWTSARRGHARTLRLSRSHQRNRRINPLKTTPRGSGQIVPFEPSGIEPPFCSRRGAGYLRLSRSQFFRREITYLFLFYCLFSLCRELVWFYLDNFFICKSDPGNFRVALRLVQVSSAADPGILFCFFFYSFSYRSGPFPSTVLYCFVAFVIYLYRQHYHPLVLFVFSGKH